MAVEPLQAFHHGRRLDRNGGDCDQGGVQHPKSP
jgi:hypothetical protein